MAALVEFGKSRRVVQGNDTVRVYTRFFGPKADFTKGASGWTATGMPVVADAFATTGFTWAGDYSQPYCIHVSQEPRFTAAYGFVDAVYEGYRVWAD